MRACIPFQYEQAPCVCLGPPVFPQETSYQHGTHTLYAEKCIKDTSMNNRNTSYCMNIKRNITHFSREK